MTQGSQTRTYNYDMLSRLTSATTPEAAYNTKYFYYTTASNALCSGDPSAVCRRVDERGITTTYTYNDALNRLTQKTYSDGTPTAWYSYDNATIWGGSTTNAKGHLNYEAVTVPNNIYNPANPNYAVEVVFSFDPLGRPLETRQTTPSGSGFADYAVDYSYNYVGSPTVLWTALDHQGVSGQRQFSYSYDAVGRLSGVTSSLSDGNHPPTLLSGITYGSVGPTADALGNNIAESFGYDNRARLSSITSTPYNLGVTYFGNSSVHTANDSVNGNWTYGYDAVNRLTSAGKSGLSFTYAYGASGNDRYGNRWQQNVITGSGPAPQLSFSATTNRITSSGYNYDAAGNLLSDGYCSYTWDGENRLATATCPNSGTTTYIYDAEDRRVAKAVGSTVTAEYVYNQAGQEVSVYGPYPSMTWQRDEIWAGSRHLATYANNTTYFHHTDQLGNLRRDTGPTGAVVATCTNLLFGDAQSCTPSDPTPYFYAGLERDPETVNDHAWARYLNSTPGRWLSPDPLAGDITNPQSLNRYAYVLNDPMTYDDPLGLQVRGPCARTLSLPGQGWCRDPTRGGEGGQTPHGSMGDEFDLVFIPRAQCEDSKYGCIDPAKYGCIDPAGAMIVQWRSTRDSHTIGPAQPPKPSQQKPPDTRPFCADIFTNRLFGGDSSPTGKAAEQAAEAGSAAAAGKALERIGERGLVVPLTSSIVRRWLFTSELLGFAAEMTPWVTFAADVLPAVVKADVAAFKGTCRGVF